MGVSADSSQGWYDGERTRKQGVQALKDSHVRDESEDQGFGQAGLKMLDAGELGWCHSTTSSFLT